MEGVRGPRSGPLETARIPVLVPELRINYAQPRASPDNLPRLHFLAAIVGSRGSGKTTALVRLLKAYFRTHSFDKLVLFCPTLRADPKYQALVKSAERHRVKVDTHEAFDDALFESTVEQINADIEEEKAERAYAEVYQRCVVKGGEPSADDVVLLEERDYEEPPKPKWKRGTPTTVLIFDDLVGNRDLYRSDAKGPVASFAIRHRHHHTSMIFLTQTYHNGVPRQLRANLSLLILFANKNDAMRKQVAAEFSSFVPQQRFLDMWDSAVGAGSAVAATADTASGRGAVGAVIPHHFFMCDFDAQNPQLRFRKNFDQIFLGSQG